MTRDYLSPRALLFIGTIATLAAVAYAQAPRTPLTRIIAADEGDVVGSHHIKADPQSGSMRLGVGLQRVTGGQGIPLHMHEKEDEVLFVHSAIYTLGATLATFTTINALGPGDLPPIVFGVAALFVGASIAVGAAGGFGIRSLVRRRTDGSIRSEHQRD